MTALGAVRPSTLGVRALSYRRDGGSGNLVLSLWGIVTLLVCAEPEPCGIRGHPIEYLLACFICRYFSLPRLAVYAWVIISDRDCEIILHA